MKRNIEKRKAGEQRKPLSRQRLWTVNGWFSSVFKGQQGSQWSRVSKDDCSRKWGQGEVPDHIRHRKSTDVYTGWDGKLMESFPPTKWHGLTSFLTGSLCQQVENRLKWRKVSAPQNSQELFKNQEGYDGGLDRKGVLGIVRISQSLGTFYNHWRFGFAKYQMWDIREKRQAMKESKKGNVWSLSNYKGWWCLNQDRVYSEKETWRGLSRSRIPDTLS